jgi:general secretion pathway protein G
MNKKDDGFTFAETIVVLVIILLLTAGVALSAMKFVDKAKVTSAKSQIETYKYALQSYYLDCGIYPSREQGLEALFEKPVLYPVPEHWNGPYIDKVVQKDPWGNEYVYSDITTNGLPFSIVSYGADGQPGGEGVNEDLFSWK